MCDTRVPGDLEMVPFGLAPREVVEISSESRICLVLEGPFAVGRSQSVGSGRKVGVCRWAAQGTADAFLLPHRRPVRDPLCLLLSVSRLGSANGPPFRAFPRGASESKVPTGVSLTLGEGGGGGGRVAAGEGLDRFSSTGCVGDA